MLYYATTEEDEKQECKPELSKKSILKTLKDIFDISPDNSDNSDSSKKKLNLQNDTKSDIYSRMSVDPKLVEQWLLEFVKYLNNGEDIQISDRLAFIHSLAKLKTAESETQYGRNMYDYFHNHCDAEQSDTKDYINMLGGDDYLKNVNLKDSLFTSYQQIDHRINTLVEFNGMVSDGLQNNRSKPGIVDMKNLYGDAIIVLEYIDAMIKFCSITESESCKDIFDMINSYQVDTDDSDIISIKDIYKRLRSVIGESINEKLSKEGINASIPRTGEMLKLIGKANGNLSFKRFIFETFINKSFR